MIDFDLWAEVPQSLTSDETAVKSATDQTEHLGAGDWRALVTITGDAKDCTRWRWSSEEDGDETSPSSQNEDQPSASSSTACSPWPNAAGRGRRRRAVPDDPDTPRPTGRLTTSDLEHVLRALDL